MWINKYYSTLTAIALCAYLHVNCGAIHSRSLYNHPATLLLGKCDLHVYIMDRTVTSNIETMSWEMWIWLLIRDTMICRMNKHIWLNEHWTIVSPITHLYINGHFPDLVQVLQQNVVGLIFTLLVKWCSLASLLHME